MGRLACHRGKLARPRHAHRPAFHAERRRPLPRRHPAPRLRRHRSPYQGLGGVAPARGLRGIGAGQLRRAWAQASLRRQRGLDGAHARSRRLCRGEVPQDAAPDRRQADCGHRLLARRLDADVGRGDRSPVSRRRHPRLHHVLSDLRRLEDAARDNARAHAARRQGRLDAGLKP